MKIRILRPCLWFAKGDIIEQSKFLEYFTGNAIENLIKYEYIEYVNI
jgi:hypothetical protein